MMKVVWLFVMFYLFLVIAASGENSSRQDMISFLPSPEELREHDFTRQPASEDIVMEVHDMDNVNIFDPSIKPRKRKVRKKNNKHKKNKKKYHSKLTYKAPPRGSGNVPRNQKPKPKPVEKRPSRPGPDFKRRPGSNIKRRHPRKAVTLVPQKAPKACSMQRKVCGSICQKTPSHQQHCRVQVNVPKLCEKKVKTFSVCPGSKPRLCDYVEEEPDICTRTKRTKVQCPEERFSCDYEITQKAPCPKDDCKKWENLRCKRGRAREPCHKPSRKCNDCRNRSFFVACKQKKWFRKEIPCSRTSTPKNNPVFSPPSLQPSPTYPPSPTGNKPNSNPKPYPSVAHATPSGSASNGKSSPSDSGASVQQSHQPFAFPDTAPAFSAARCFASYFDETECTSVSPSCNVLDNRTFDGEKCTYEACKACDPSSHHKRSTELKLWCQEFRERYCYFSARKLVSQNPVQYNVPIAPAGHEGFALDLESSVRSSKKCFKDESRIVTSRCEKQLPRNEVCYNGCRVKACSKGKQFGPHGYCKDNLPPHCRGRKQGLNCKRKRTIKKTCTKPGKKNCVGVITEPYVCSKKKKVKKPCQKQACKGLIGCFVDQFHKKCTQQVKQKYVCGTRSETKIASCSQGSRTNCTPKYCTVKVCH